MQQPEYILPARAETLIMGRLDPRKAPVLSVPNGAVVQIETISSVKRKSGQTAREFFTSEGLDLHDTEVGRLCDALDGLRHLDPEYDPAKWGIHKITGPLEIQGAQPGDVLEVQILDTKLTVPYGNAMTFPQISALPDEIKEDCYRVITYDEQRMWGSYLGLRIPLHPFFGILGVAPSTPAHSSPPGMFGGNIDCKHLVKGTSLYLPVLMPGALFYAGDPHAAQGNGEVSMCAIETAALTGIFRFVLHRGTAMQTPIIETPTHYIILGMAKDLQEAFRDATRRCIAFLQLRKGISFEDAMILSSIAVDFEVTQVVNGAKGIHAMLSKQVLQLEHEDFWNADGSVFYHAAR